MTHVTRVLCAVDFSDQSRHALEHAVALARSWHASLVALHVHQAAPTPAAGHAGEASAAALTPTARAGLLDALIGFVEANGAPDLRVDTALGEAPLVPRAIIARAEAEQADVIVLGTHGRSGFERCALGAVAERVLRTSPVPVLTVPPSAPERVSLPPPAIQRIICPVDFGACSARAIDQAASLADRASATLTIVHIVDLPPQTAEPERPEFMAYRAHCFADGRRQLRQVVPDVARRSVRSQLVLVGKPYREIVRLAAEQEADLIVMGVRGRGTLDRMVFGSTTNQVVHQAGCPVLTVRD